MLRRVLDSILDRIADALAPVIDRRILKLAIERADRTEKEMVRLRAVVDASIGESLSQRSREISKPSR